MICAIGIVLNGLVSKRVFVLGVSVSVPNMRLSNDEKYQSTVRW